MSHLNNSADPLFHYEYSRATFNKLRILKNVWIMATVLLSIAWLIVAYRVFTQDVVVLISMAALAFGILLTGLAARNAWTNYAPVARMREDVYRVFNLFDSFDNKRYRKINNTPFDIIVEYVSDGMLVSVSKDNDDPMQVPMLYSVSETHVSTLQGPDIMQMIFAFEYYIKHVAMQTRSVETIEGSLHRVEVPEVPQQHLDAMQLQGDD